MSLDPWHQDTRDMAVRALERADQAHDRLDRQSAWMQAVDERIAHLADRLNKVASEIASLKAKVAFGAAIGSLAGGLIVGLVVKLVN